MNNILFKNILENFVKLIDDGLIFENIISEDPLILFWENDDCRFRFDSEKNTVYVEPKVAVQQLDVQLTILPSGSSLEELS